MTDMSNKAFDLPDLKTTPEGVPSWIGNGSLVWSSKPSEFSEDQRPEKGEKFEQAWLRIFKQSFKSEVALETWNGGDDKTYTRHERDRVSVAGEDKYRGIITPNVVEW